MLRRLLAFGVDYLVIALYAAALTFVFLGLGVGRSAGVERFVADPLGAQLLGFALLTLPVVLYFAGWECSSRQATPGKRALGLRVGGRDGERLPWSRSLLRSAVKFAPWELAHTCLWRIPGWPADVQAMPAAVLVGLAAVWLLVGAYLLAPLFDPLRRTPYDRLAGSLVTRTPREEGALHGSERR